MCAVDVANMMNRTSEGILARKKKVGGEKIGAWGSDRFMKCYDYRGKHSICYLGEALVSH